MRFSCHTRGQQDIAGQETRQLKGYLYTKEMILKTEGRKPKQKELTTIMHMGKRVSGVLQKVWAFGCIEVWDKGGRQSELAAEVSSTSHLAADEVKYSASNAAASLRSSTVQKKDGSISLRAENTKKRFAPDSSEDSDAIMESIWGQHTYGKPSTTKKKKRKGSKDDSLSDATPEDEGTQQEKQHAPARTRLCKKKATQAPHKAGRKTLSNFTKRSSNNASDKSKQVSTTKAIKEISNGEAVALQCKQLKGHLETSEIMNVTSKQVSALLLKLQTRLREPMVAAYLGGSDPVSLPSDHRGLKVYDELMEHSKWLPHVALLVECIQAQEGPQASATMLEAALSHARKLPGLSICEPPVKTQTLARKLREHVAGDVKDSKAVLDMVKECDDQSMAKSCALHLVLTCSRVSKPEKNDIDAPDPREASIQAGRLLGNYWG